MKNKDFANNKVNTLVDFCKEKLASVTNTVELRKILENVIERLYKNIFFDNYYKKNVTKHHVFLVKHDIFYITYTNALADTYVKIWLKTPGVFSDA